MPRVSDEEFRQAHAEKLTDNELAARFGMSASGVAIRRKRMGLALNPTYRFRIDREELKRLHALNLCDQEIADQLGCSKSSVTEIRVGMKLSSNPPPRPAIPEEPEYIPSNLALTMADKEWERMLGAAKFEDHPRAPKSRGALPRLLPRPSEPILSSTGNAAAMCAAVGE